MNITIVCDVLGEENNGTTVAAMNLIRYLKSRGHDVRVVCPDEDKQGLDGYYIVPKLNVGPLNDYVRRYGVTIARANKAILEAAMENADIVHTMTPFLLGRACVMCAKAHGIPITAGFHCQAENITNHLFLMNNKEINDQTYYLLYRRVYRHVDAIHYPTQFIRDIFESLVGPTNGYVISNGVNSRFVRMDVERAPELAGKFVILFTGRYGREKSHKVLIDAVSLIPDSENIQLIFAGEGPLHEEIQSYAAQKLKTQPIMRFFSRDEMLRVINSADLYVHPAEIEIEAIACLEAIKCGLVPVIADSPRSATRYFALDERNLFHYNDPADLAEKIRYWRGHPEEKAACSERYLGYTEKFDQGRCMEAMEEMLIRESQKKKGIK